jgi:hypothetical protein
MPMEETKKEQKFYEVDKIKIHMSRPGEFVLFPLSPLLEGPGEVRVRASKMECWMKTPLKALYYEDNMLTIQTPHKLPFTCVLKDDTLVCEQ